MYKLVIREGKGEKVVASMNVNKTLHSSKKKVNTKISVFLQRSPLWEISAHKKSFWLLWGTFGVCARPLFLGEMLEEI